MILYYNCTITPDFVLGTCASPLLLFEKRVKSPLSTAPVALTPPAKPNSHTKTLPHTEMENLSLYVMLTAVFLAEVKKVGIGCFLSARNFLLKCEKVHIHIPSFLCCGWAALFLSAAQSNLHCVEGVWWVEVIILNASHSRILFLLAKGYIRKTKNLSMFYWYEVMKWCSPS